MNDFIRQKDIEKTVNYIYNYCNKLDIYLNIINKYINYFNLSIINKQYIIKINNYIFFVIITLDNKVGIINLIKDTEINVEKDKILDLTKYYENI